MGQRAGSNVVTMSPAEQLAAWSETFLVPLVAALERSQATVNSQAETIGRQSAELEAARARISTLEASGAPQAVETAPEPFWSRWRTSAPWVLLAVILLLAVVLLRWLR